MLLPQQIQAILYHLVMGIVYGVSYSFITYTGAHIPLRFLKGLWEVIYHVFFTLLMFYGLYRINGGITNIYLIVIFILGVIIFYKFYFRLFQSIYKGIGNICRPFILKLRLVKNKMFVIIKVPAKRMKRRIRSGAEKRKKRQDSEKKEAPV